MEKLGADKIFPAPPVPGDAMAVQLCVRAPRPGHLEIDKIHDIIQIDPITSQSLYTGLIADPHIWANFEAGRVGITCFEVHC